MDNDQKYNQLSYLFLALSIIFIGISFFTDGWGTKLGIAAGLCLVIFVYMNKKVRTYLYGDK
jgi:membrane-bound ClpP family serine protease